MSCTQEQRLQDQCGTHGPSGKMNRGSPLVGRRPNFKLHSHFLDSTLCYLGTFSGIITVELSFFSVIDRKEGLLGRFCLPDLATLSERDDVGLF